MPVDLLLYAVIAAVLVLWLRNTLGTKSGSERDRSEILDQLRERQQQHQQQKESAGRVIDITDRVSEVPDQPAGVPLEGIEIEGGAETAQEVLDLIRSDSGFDPKQFIAGAREAFPMIVEAFAKGDLRTLKMLLSDGVYASFEQAIEDRRTRGETLVTDVLAIRNCRIVGVRRIEKMVYVRLRFIAEETIVVRDREGQIISGHPDKMVTMNDVWTFGRALKSKDPTWYLYETADDVPEEHGNHIPDSQI